jgi:hypothetical protein
VPAESHYLAAKVTIWKRRGAARHVFHTGLLTIEPVSRDDLGTAMRFCCTFCLWT